jgi:hypothetical protein
MGKRTIPLFISHRGNLFGPNPELENSPLAISRALHAGFHVEVDVRWDISRGCWWLGHDRQQYAVDETLLLDPRIWCHAKTSETMTNLLTLGAHCFVHDRDPYASTSREFIWLYPGESPPSNRGIAVLPENVMSEALPVEWWAALAGLCTDYPYRYVEEFYAAHSDPSV